LIVIVTSAVVTSNDVGDTEVMESAKAAAEMNKERDIPRNTNLAERMK